MVTTALQRKILCQGYHGIHCCANSPISVIYRRSIMSDISQDIIYYVDLSHIHLEYLSDSLRDISKMHKYMFAIVMLFGR